MPITPKKMARILKKNGFWVYQDAGFSHVFQKSSNEQGNDGTILQ
ncbi:hypothetical protein DFP96_105147 [Listeria rocourtiae]|uniref:HicA-like toxin of HicAB toxin-antitoxin system n=1 Tax=Listeria rocourtiae TaxID=647910 RepID=A0A4R6ZLR5_9LIST|nr:hypothetical protein DFP96_105147 [Listeria rocourtiae]